MKSLFFAALTLLSTWSLVAQTPDPNKVKVSVEGLRHDFYVVPTGADIGFTMGPWKLVVGGGYEHLDFGRDAATGDPLISDTTPSNKQLFINGGAKLRYTWVFDEADLWLGGGATGYGNLGLGPRSAGAFADLDGNTFGFLEAGATRDRRQYNPHGLESGTFAEATVQWSPPALASRGTDYQQFSLKTAVFFPLWDWEGPAQVFSGLVAFRADVQWTDGKAVPFPLLLPTEVRGYYRLYDARLLSVATGELRVRLPSLSGAHDLVPVGFGFVDAGQYLGYADSTTANDRSGLLAGAGVGGGLEFYGVATPTLTLGMPLISGTGLWWTLDFNLRF